jgi:hypothetical protein
MALIKKEVGLLPVSEAEQKSICESDEIEKQIVAVKQRLSK